VCGSTLISVKMERMGFKHILVPTDGSARSRRAIRTAANLARQSGARLTALYVVPEGVPTLFSGDKLYASPALAPQYRAALRAAADEALGVAAKAAKAAGLAYAGMRSLSPAPWKSIVNAARARRCDLIVMATHGKRGLWVLGSQTMKVLAHTCVPVLVCR
jgi:nucleotide-binding universal stress UspA family protein